MNARQIVSQYTNGGMSSRPEFTSGRGVTLSDLNSKWLFAIRKGIEKEVGKEQAEEFVKMVASMKKMSATAFLNNLYMLERFNWKWTPLRDQHISVNSRGDAMGTVLSVMSGMSSRDDTKEIRGHFLEHFGYKPIYSESPMKDMKECPKKEVDTFVSPLKTEEQYNRYKGNRKYMDLCYAEKLCLGFGLVDPLDNVYGWTNVHSLR